MPSLTQDFEGGEYRIDYFSVAPANGSVRCQFRIQLDSVEIVSTNESLFSNPFMGAMCSVLTPISAGEHTIDFEVRKENVAASPFLENRYYVITKLD